MNNFTNPIILPFVEVDVTITKLTCNAFSNIQIAFGLPYFRIEFDVT